jgi:signal transduction histidine kinase
VKVARAGLVVPKPEMLEMTELIKTVVDSIKIKIKESNTIITMEDLPPCFADRNHTIQIFTNLIDNAVKYLAAERQGQISIEAKIEKDTVIYCVMDNGIGIAREHQEKIFDTYYRIVEKKSVGGEGIGLSVVKGMVERNNGRIWLESEKGKGSKFCVRLPKSSSKKL